tara:strand:- start:7739 stop:8950 length:1212 start_codon:yes stop_codon:yes gene_type:complete
MNTETIEDCLELLVGFQTAPKGMFTIKREDYNILTSLGRQVVRGIGLTDRQHELLKTKLLSYNDMFENDITKSFDNLRVPLRQLNREKTIKLVYNDSDELCIAVKFIFNKKLLTAIEKAKVGAVGHLYNSKEKIHYFPFNELNVYQVISNFKNNNFDIEAELYEYFQKVEAMSNNQDDYVPGIYSFKLKNLSDRAIDFMISSIGEPTKENLAIYNDRKDQLGLHHFDQQELEESLNALTILSKKIVQRKEYNVIVPPDVYPIERVLESLLELNRFPLLVILPIESPLEGLVKINKGLRNIIFEQDMSVLFRVSNDKNSNKDFNEYVKLNKLNNILDTNTKVVYINSNKFPKPLLKSEWRPNTVLTIGSVRMHAKVNDYVNPLDLIIHYDTDISPFNRAKVQTL